LNAWGTRCRIALIQIWFLAFNDAVLIVSFVAANADSERVFNNADSFAMVFDRTWKRLNGSSDASSSPEERIKAVLEAMAEHPFLISSPEMAQQVAIFRIRLLDLS
jgi:hypothetical protein